MKYKRVLYKISGEALMGDGLSGSYDISTMKSIAEDVQFVCNKGVELCLVVGGGNIYRGIYGEKIGMERSVADYMGMLATVMNALALQNVLENIGVEARVQSALPISSVCEPYIRRRAIRHLEKGRVVICAAGTGNPFFTTDTAAILRAMELKCECLIKGTSVDGIYSEDPKKSKNAQRFETISYQELIEKNLKIMDMSAVSLARDNNIPIKVFSIKQENALEKVLTNKTQYTLVTG
ncbi:MAG: uridylate kinase [Candidatus Deianiraeaceae bacterium]|jgi:uridylate kinase